MIFFKKFFNFSSLSDLARQHITFFVIFFLNFCKVSSLKAVMTILSLLFVLFSWFLAFLHAFRGYFRTSLFLGFLMIQGLFSEIGHWVLMGYWYIHVWYWLIWSILGLYEKLKILGFMLKSVLGILLNWVKIDEIGLLFWCNWSFYSVFYLVWWSTGQFILKN